MSLPHIVVVEDEPAIRRGVTDALRISGYTVSEAADGDAGLEAALRRDAGLILLDLLLPRRGGLDVLSRIAQIAAEPAGHHPDRPRLRGRPCPRPENGGGRLRRQTVLGPRTARPRRSRPAAGFNAAGGDHRRPARQGEARPATPRGPLARRRSRRIVRNRDGHPRLLARPPRPDRDPRRSARERLGHPPHGLETRAVDMHIARLRAKLRDPSGKPTPEAVVTVRARGYMAGPELVPVEANGAGLRHDRDAACPLLGRARVPADCGARARRLGLGHGRVTAR